MSKAEELLSLYEMSNIGKRTTGLDYVIWVSQKGKAKHSARIKISKQKNKNDPYNTVSMTIEDEPKMIAGKGLPLSVQSQVSQFIIKNKDILLMYWKGEILTEELLDGLVPV